MAERVGRDSTLHAQYRRNHLLRIAVVVLVSANSACDSCNQKATNPSKNGLKTSRSSSLEPSKTTPVGIVEGFVKLQEGAAIPSYPAEQMSQQILRSKPTEMPKICSAANRADRQPVRLTRDGKLVGVLVAGSKLKQPPTREAKTHDITIEDCRLKPSFVVAQKGDKLRIRNHTDFPFMPQFGPSAFMETLIKGQEKVIDLNQGGYVNPVLCGYTASCGRTDVIVLYDAIHAITDEKGHFRIENYPAGQESLLNVWHPLFRETSIPVTLAPGETKTVEIELGPLDKYADKEAPQLKDKPIKEGR